MDLSEVRRAETPEAAKAAMRRSVEAARRSRRAAVAAKEARRCSFGRSSGRMPSRATGVSCKAGCASEEEEQCRCLICYLSIPRLCRSIPVVVRTVFMHV